MFTKKTTALISALALAATMSLAACKKKKDEPQGTPKVEETTPPGTTPTPTEPSMQTPPAVPSAQTPPTATAPTGTTAPAATTGIAACDSYVAVYEKFTQCEKVPPQAKDAAKSALESAKNNWAQLQGANVAEEAKKSATTSCQQSEESLKTTAQSSGCSL